MSGAPGEGLTRRGEEDLAAGRRAFHSSLSAPWLGHRVPKQPGPGAARLGVR